eukprot:CAMPEP_0181344842 /NCGR_PEP_ID=MMETSP1101-20121128/32417_1 /TAXON_ID=46948 /ORGANISM="Rhodomonas abbreviata, Strain Caron Lab Isolate" /LENGTH=880 /DNA_ID=CAMNT_0023456729 /DNA_START=124 /DNA_END=2763 /DNA_ORIENTATION=+
MKLRSRAPLTEALADDLDVSSARQSSGCRTNAMPLRGFLALTSVVFAYGMPHHTGFAFPHGTTIVQETNLEAYSRSCSGHVCHNTRPFRLRSSRGSVSRFRIRDEGAHSRLLMMVSPDSSATKRNETEEEEIRLLERFNSGLTPKKYLGTISSAVQNRMQKSFPKMSRRVTPATPLQANAPRNESQVAKAKQSSVLGSVGSLWKTATNFSFPTRRSRQRIRVQTLDELEMYMKQNVSIHQLDIRGRSQPWRQSESGELLEALHEENGFDEEREGRADGRERQQHPVLRAIWKRMREGSKPGERKDNYRIALAIEGGGLRGSVTAGMASAIMHLGMGDAFDMVLGSSAGSIIGTYLVARAEPKMTYQFFCNHLTMSRDKLNGSSWLDMGRLVDLFTPDSIPRRQDKSPVMVLDYPMKTIMQELLPVDWKKFQENNKHQPMKVVAAGLFSEGPVVLGSDEGSFHDLASLCECVKASCMLPGVAGVQPPWLRGSSALHPEKLRDGQRRWVDQEMQRSVLFKARDVFMQQLKKQVRQKVSENGAGAESRAGAPGIDRSELKEVLAELSIDPTEEELRSIMEVADLDGNGLIDLEEFKVMIGDMLKASDLSQWFQPLQDVEPMVDALVYEPIPYRSAIDYNCTHILVLRSYPDGKLLPRSLLGLFERLVAPKCLDPFPQVKSHLQSAGHSIVYAEDILKLNAAVEPSEDKMEEVQVEDARDVGRLLAAQTARWSGMANADLLQQDALEEFGEGPHLFAVSPLDTDGEVSQLTLNREVLLRGIMQGFARAYDLLVPDSSSSSSPDAKPAGGDQVAADVYLPIHYKFLQQLAAQGQLDSTYTKRGYKRGVTTRKPLFFNQPVLRPTVTRGGKAGTKSALMGKRVPRG